MFDFLVRNFSIKNAQKFIDKLTPKVNVHIPKDLPLPSVSLVKKLCLRVAKINALEEKMLNLTDDQLRSKTAEFKAIINNKILQAKQAVEEVDARYKSAKSNEERNKLNIEKEKVREALIKAKREVLNSILEEAFAVVREVAKRILNMRHYDVQMVGGMVLHEGNIAEMTTGEGKTLVATCPVYLNALTEEGVHVITVNDYLAKRDRDWMGPIFEFLGLTVGVIQHDIDPRSRQSEYNCDITYGTNNEFGFDYLRDNMVTYKEEMVQRRHHFCVVDEVDSILVDEARTPLIISGPAEESTDKYYRANNIVQQLNGRRVTEQEQVDAKHRQEDLTSGFDYTADEKSKAISLTDQGEEKAAKLFGIDNMHDMETIEYRHHVLQAIRAKEFFRADVDYVVRDGKVIIVDEFTGRLMPGRRWSDGLHQAVEAREGIKIERENQTLATVTFQNYFRMYEKLSGMTGTAYTEASEFKEIYGLDCEMIPTNRILQRTNYSDKIYRSVREKFNAVVEEIEECHKKGQPVLVGTISIEKSELVSSLLKAKGVPHQVLNAKYHDLEAHIIAQAGRHKAVTIATNMAGRGTDIVLGGNAEYLAQKLLAEKADKDDSIDQEKQLEKFIRQFKEQVEREHVSVVEAGGLHVLGTERHESRRIDNQLRGRSGRQGDPGSSCFYVSLEDDLMRLFASDRIVSIMNKLGMEEGDVIDHPLVTRTLEIAQKRVEAHNFEIRKQLIEYDNVMNKQREAIYNLRRSILEGEYLKDWVMEAVEDVAYALVQMYFYSIREDSDWDKEGLIQECKSRYDLEIVETDLFDKKEEELLSFLLEKLKSNYDRKENEMSSENMRRLEKIVLLQTIDAKWKEHLYSMDQLKEGIGLRAYGQRDPLIEYKREGFAMFQSMYASINEEVVETIFNVQSVSNDEQRPRSVFGSLPQEFVHKEFSSLDAQAFAPQQPGPGPQETPSVPPVQSYQRDGRKVGRNDPCPCGSGKKFKKCCGK